MRQINAKKLLEQANLRKTSGRIALIEILINADKPLTQQEIMEKLPENQMNYVSIYRALESFMQSGILHKIEGVDRVWRFALNGNENREHIHPHFICKSCGETECLHNIEIPKFYKFKPGYVVEDQEILLKGLCAYCVNYFALN